MKREWHFLSVLQNSVWIFFYIIIVLITIVFNTALTWLFLFFFTSLFLVNALILLPNINNIQFDSHEITDSPAKRLLLTFSSNKKGPPIFPHLRMTFYFDAHGEELYTTKKTALFFTQNETLSLSIDDLPRGEYPNVPLTISSFDFFGIFVKRKDRTLPFSFYVLPEKQLSVAQLLFNALQEQQLLTTKKDLMHNYNLKTIREYQENDHMSQIDWKLSEKANILLTKEYDYESQEDILFLFWGYDSDGYEDILSFYYSLYLLQQESNPVFWIADRHALLEIKSTNQFSTAKPVESNESLLSQLRNINLINKTVFLFFEGNSSEQQVLASQFNSSNDITFITYSEEILSLQIQTKQNSFAIDISEEVEPYFKENSD